MDFVSAGASDPRLEALAFRIWQVADPHGWRVTVDDLAAMLDEPEDELRLVVRAKGWCGRVAPSTVPA